MKKTDWKIFIATVVYTLLFYKQEPGLNFLLFSILISVLSLLQDTAKLKKPAWLAAVFGTLFSGFFVFYYGTNLPIVANVISIIFLAGFTFKSSTSLLLSAFNSLTSLVLALPYMVIDFFRNRAKPIEERSQKTSWFKKFFLLLFPLFVVLVFFVLYRDSNPLFLKITEKINLDWLSFPLVQQFLVALFFMYSFFVHNTIKRLNAFDEKTKDEIDFIDEEKHQKSFFARFISLESETYTASALLIMLNVLIALLNGIDIFYLWYGAALPQGLVFSDYLHSGTFTLILSILLAIAIVVFFFRGIFNFNSNGKWLKLLGFAWVLQNIVMIVSAMLRNKMYIEQYGMTHKRIGVYVFLTLAVIGLLMAFVKIAAKKNIWFLFRKNAWAFYAVLVFGTAINWDYIITKYNVKNANKNHIVDLDKNYLGNLSHVNTYILTQLENDTTPYEMYYFGQKERYQISPIQEKLQTLLDYNKRNQWQENCFFKNKNIDEIKKQNAMGKIAKLDLFSMYLDEVTIYEELSNIKGLDAQQNNFKNNLKGLSNYAKLEVLNLSSNNITKLDSLPVLPKITHLNLSQNEISNFSKLKPFTALKALDISSKMKEIDVESFPVFSKLESINISTSNYNDWSFLSKQPVLNEIIFQSSSPYNVSIPNIVSLEKVDLSNSTLLSNSGSFFDSLSVCKNIKELYLFNCHLGSTFYLVNEKTNEALYKNLKVLNLANNNLGTGISFLKAYTNLKDLDISNNGINAIKPLKNLVNLTSLNLNENSINDLENLNAFVKLETLNMSKVTADKIDYLLTLVNLKTLDISKNYIKNIDSIVKLKNLEVLDVSDNKLEDLSVLKNLKNLRHLNISNNNLKDYAFLFEMKQLEYLSLGNVDLSIVELLKEKLPKTVIDYYSQNLDMDIMYNKNKRTSYSESF